MKLSLRNRFLVPTMVLTLLGMGALALLCGLVTRQALTENLDAQLKQARDLTEHRITTYIKDRKAELTAWSKNSSLHAVLIDDAEEGVNAASFYLSELQKQSAYFEMLNLENTGGDIIASSVRSAVGKINVKDRDYFNESMKGNAFVSGANISRTNGNLVIMVSVPVKEGEKIIGVMHGNLNLGAFNEAFMDPVKVGKAGFTFTFQRDGAAINHPDKSSILKINAKDQDFTREMMARGEGLIRYEYQGRLRLAAFKTNPETGWVFAIGADQDEMFEPIQRLFYINAGGVAGVTLLMGVLIILIANSTIRPIREIAKSLGKGAEQVAAASEQIAELSSHLAEGASQQAASIEETSSSLEEMSSMTKQTTDHADQANKLMAETAGVVEKANQSMNSLTSAMVEISAASEETSKIIKTIDEIAFQTNLLALNAAVEAARAGEAGAGFAVVADEVRNLAMRAADAAKNTAALIEGTVSKIRDGSEMVEKTSSEFSQVAVSSGKMRDLVAEISAASTEQSQGISQIGRAVGEMDKVVQQNAAQAEESAGASEEMKVRADEMKLFVDELASIIGTGAAAESERKEGKTYRGRTEGKIPDLRINSEKRGTGNVRRLPGRNAAIQSENNTMDF